MKKAEMEGRRQHGRAIIFFVAPSAAAFWWGAKGPAHDANLRDATHTRKIALWATVSLTLLHEETLYWTNKSFIAR